MADAQKEAGAAGLGVAEASDFAALLNKEFRPKSDEAKSAVENAVKTLAEQALANATLISDDALRSIQSIIAEIDKKLTQQINEISSNWRRRGAGCIIW